MPAKRLLPATALARRTILGAVPASFLPTPGLSRAARPRDWAQPIEPALQGVPNFYRVSALIFRSAQPDAQGFSGLTGLGIRSVLSLRQTR